MERLPPTLNFFEKSGKRVMCHGLFYKINDGIESFGFGDGQFGKDFSI